MSAAAGQRGPEIRSDAWIEVSEAGAPGLTLRSRVETLYGASIRAQLTEALARLGAADLAVSVEDSGALPYVLLARLEAAVRALRPAAPAELLPPPQPAAFAPPRRPGLRRSRLYLPGNTPKFFVNAGLHGPDAVILDLEDSVAPGEKAAARVLVRNALRAVDFHGAEKMVRVNALPDGLDEIRLLAPHGAHTFVLPKVESPEAVRAAAAVLDALGRPETGLIPILESPRGVLNALAIAEASPRVTALTIGLEDYTRALGAPRTRDGAESAWARGQLVNAARAAGVQPLASVYGQIDDEAGLRAFAAEARALGYEGVGCLHPRQIRVVHAAWAPSPAAVAEARRIVAAYAAALAGGQGVVAVDGAMVDAPVAARARQVLAAAGEEVQP